MAEGGIFLDILTRLNAASVDKVIKDAQEMMRKAGTVGAESFTTSVGRSVSAGSKAMFDPLVEASNVAFREMQINLANLQVAEARINELRARNFKTSTDQMIAAQRQLDAAISNSQKLMADSAKANAAVRDGMVAARMPSDRTAPARRPAVPAPITRGLGIAAAGSGLFLAWGADQNYKLQTQTQQVYARGNENQADIGRATQWMWQNAGRLGTSPLGLATTYNQAERMGYRGQDAINLVNTAAEVAKRSGADLEETVKGLDTTLSDLGYSTSEHKANLDQLNKTASQLTFTLDNMKLSGQQATEFFGALHSIEPTLMAIQNAVPGNTTQAQADALMQVLNRHGVSPERGGQNIGHFAMTLAGMRPDSPQYQALAQLGINPQDIANQIQTQGITTALNTIHNQVQAKSFIGPDGQQLIHTGMQFNNDQLYSISKQIYDTLSDAGKAFVDSHPEVNAGVTSGAALRKDLEKGEVPQGDVQNILAYSHDRALLTGLNPKVKKGGYADMTPEEYYNWLFGSGDTSRTGTILLTNMGDVNKAVSANMQAGPNNYLQNSFDKLMQGLPLQWQKFQASMQALAGKLSESVIPALTDFVGHLNGVVGWLDKHKTAEEALTDAMLGLVAAWGAAKLINLGADLLPALSFAADKARKLGQLMSDRLPTQIEGGAATLATEEATAGTNLKTSLQTAGETSATTIEGGATTAAGEMAAGGTLFKNGLSAFIEVSLPTIIGDKISDWLQGFHFTLPDIFKNGFQAPGKIKGMLDGQLDPNTGKPYAPGAAPPPFQSPLPPNVPTLGRLPHHAYGGVVGQPLIGVPDTGGDSVLGMLPNGQPVGLRGGEGILTPETVQALGGEAGVNALNKNPWANPFKAATTLYSSFAKGVAQYSPFGKYLVANSQSLSDLEKQQEDANKIQQRADKKELKSLADFMINFYSDRYAAAGDKYAGPSLKSIMDHPTKYWYDPDTGEFQSTGSAIKRGSPDVMSAILNAASSAGLNQTQYDDVKWIFSHESGFDPTISNGGSHGAPSNDKAYGLGQFLGHMGDKYGAMGAYSGDPYKETLAAIQYMNDRYGSPAAAKAYWESHGNYSHGGVVGYAGGGVVGGIMAPGIGGGPDPGTWTIPNYKGADDLTSAQGPWLNGIRKNQYLDDQGNWLTPWGASWPKGWSGDPVVGKISDVQPPRDPGSQVRYPLRDIMDYGNVWSDWNAVMAEPPTRGTNQAAYHFALGGIIPTPPRAPAPTPTPAPPTPTAGNQQKYPPPGHPVLAYPPQKPKAPKKPLHDGRQKNVYGNIPNAYKIPGGTSPTGDRNIKENPSQQLTAEGNGFSIGGGLLGALESAGAAAADMFAPGSGQAAQPLFDLANLAVGFGGKLVGIGMEGFMETLLPNDSPAADPSKNIFGKMALGIAGAHSSGKNMAGSHAKQLDVKKNLDKGAMQAKQMPGGIHVHGDIHNHTGDHSETFNAMNKAVNFANHAGTFAGQ